MQIIILGMHRSGTSTVARLINMLGAYVGPERMMLEHPSGRLSTSNPRGHWERRDVMDINDAILAHVGARWDAPKGADGLSLERLPEALRHKLELLVYGLDAHRPWMLKDPRLCLTFPCWRPLLDVPVVVMVHRTPQAVVESLHTRNGFSREKALMLWEYYVTASLNNSLKLPRIFIDYDRLLADPVGMVAELYKHLQTGGVRRLEMPHEREILRFINPDLNRSKSKSAMVALPLTSHQIHLTQIMQHGLPMAGKIEIGMLDV